MKTNKRICFWKEKTSIGESYCNRKWDINLSIIIFSDINLHKMYVCSSTSTLNLVKENLYHTLAFDNNVWEVKRWLLQTLRWEESEPPGKPAPHRVMFKDSNQLRSGVNQLPEIIQPQFNQDLYLAVCFKKKADGAQNMCSLNVFWWCIFFIPTVFLVSSGL